MTTVAVSYPIYLSQVQQGVSPLNFNESTTGGKRSVVITNNTAWSSGQWKYFTIKTSKPFDFYCSTNASIALEILDEQGNPQITTRFTNTVSTKVTTLQSYFTYNIGLFASGALTAASTLLTITGQVLPTVSQFFSNGIVNQVPPSTTGVAVAYDTFGQPTYTFTNYPLINGQQLVLALATFANQSGTLTITSSDSTVFNSYTDPFNVGSSIYVAVMAMKSTSFTGTITVGITGVGVGSTVDLDLIGDPPNLSLVPTNLLAAAPMDAPLAVENLQAVPILPLLESAPTLKRARIE